MESTFKKKAVSKKQLKGSKRGLTFSFDEREHFRPGEKYRYMVDMRNHTILIVPTADRGNMVSRKKCGEKFRSLIDIRSREIRELVSKAVLMEVELLEDEIIVHLYEKKPEAQVISMEEMRTRSASLSISRELLMAAGVDSVTGGLNTGIHGVSCEKPTLEAELKDVIRVVSLFSGAGMLDYPFSKDDAFKIVYAAEYDSDAVGTYRKNIGEHIHEVDIRTLCGKELPPCDIIIGGPPCQPFSNANRHNGARHENHEEGDMFYHYIRLIKEAFVKVFVLENVPSLIMDKGGFYLDKLRNMLPEYKIAAKTYEDSDLGGFTKRKRVLIIGSRIGKVFMPDYKLRPARTTKEALLKVNDEWPNATDITHSSDAVRRKIAMIPEGGNWQDLPESQRTKSVHSNMYRRLDRNAPAVAIANWRKYLLSPPRWDNSGKWDRILSVSEAAALQGFGKDFVFTGTLNSKQQQVANGVTYAMGKFIRSLVKRLFVFPDGDFNGANALV